MQQNPDIVQRALEEAARLTAGSHDGSRGSVAVVAAIRDRLVNLESDLRSSEARVEEIQGDLRSAREESAQAAAMHARQLIAVTDNAAIEIEEVRDVASRAIAGVEAAAERERLRLQGENAALREQLDAKAREAEGLSEALRELLSGIRHSQMTERREREEVDILIGGLLDLVPQGGQPVVAAPLSTGQDVFSVIENLVMGAAEPGEHQSGEVITLPLGRVA